MEYKGEIIKDEKRKKVIGMIIWNNRKKDKNGKEE